MPNISKSRFLSGSQCTKKLFYDVHQPELARDIFRDERTLLEAGHEVGRLARLVFPDGLDATPHNTGEYADAIRQTREWIDGGASTIYEAAFVTEGAFAALDILHRNNGETWAIEVKATTRVKDYHITDCAFQYWVMDQAGVKPDRMFLMHLDNAYVLDGSLVLEKLFKLEDITDRVTGLQGQIRGERDQFIDILSASSAPVQDIGKHCKDPFECKYKDHCWQHVPTPSVFNLYRAGTKAHTMYQSGIVRIEDIPDDAELSRIQQIQVRSMTGCVPHTNPEAIRTYLSDFEAPLHFFDFETINPATPILQGTSPFAQVPFQFSMYITEVDGDVIDHHAYLADAATFREHDRFADPRRSLINAMKGAFGRVGSIVAFNKSFEENVIKALAKYFPDERDFLESLLPRFVDLLEPFRSGWCYTPAMLGSFSIKSVLPALVPKMDYGDLAIQGGAVASDTFHSMISGETPPDDLKTRQDLIDYCDRDTMGMVAVYRHIRALV